MAEIDIVNKLQNDGHRNLKSVCQRSFTEMVQKIRKPNKAPENDNFSSHIKDNREKIRFPEAKAYKLVNTSDW